MPDVLYLRVAVPPDRVLPAHQERHAGESVGFSIRNRKTIAGNPESSGSSGTKGRERFEDYGDGRALSS
jgi:hypothetical protein